jgi:hypothetical protein
MASITVKSLNLKSAIRRVTRTGSPSPVRTRHLQQRARPPITRPNHHGGLTPTWAVGRAHQESSRRARRVRNPVTHRAHRELICSARSGAANSLRRSARPGSSWSIYRPQAEPHTGTPQVGWDARERPSRKTCPVKIPAWVPYTGYRADACGLLPQPGGWVLCSTLSLPDGSRRAAVRP